VIQSVDRAIRVLTALQGSRRMALSELATRLELPPSTVHGLVRTLVAHGLVVQERGSNRYQLGPAVLRLGNVYLDTIELRSKAIPWAEDVARRTGLAVRTAVLLLDDVVIIHHEPRPDGSRQMPEVGIVIPAHASALGKAILAYQPEGLLAELTAEPLPRLTSRTLTAAQLTAEVADVRDKGLARERDEAVLGESSLAAPIVDHAGHAVGAIAVVGETRRILPRGPAKGLPEAVTDAARSISRELGAPRWPIAAP